MPEPSQLSSPGAARWLRHSLAAILLFDFLASVLSLLSKMTPAVSDPPAGVWTLLLLFILGVNVLWAVWVFRLHRDLQSLLSGYPISPWKSVAMLLIPLYNYYGMWRTWKSAGEHLPATQSDTGRPTPHIEQIFPWFYAGWAISRAIARLSVRLPESILLDLVTLVSDMAFFAGLYLLCLSADRGIRQLEATQAQEPGSF